MDAVESAIKQLQSGGMIILSDDSSRENEGDLVVAAEFITPEMVVFMSRFSSGIISVPMSEARLTELNIPLMVPKNREAFRTAFSITVDAAAGITTGSSAYDRALTIRKLASPTSVADDFVRPGHVNPIMARPGGLSERRGHTEAAIELMKLAGLAPVAVISEIMADSGQMSDEEELKVFANKFGLPWITVRDVVGAVTIEATWELQGCVPAP